MLIPKLPFVSNSRILAPFARLSHTLILPSNDVAARYCPSSERTIAHISPALLPSTQVSALYILQIGQLCRRKAAPTISVLSPHRPSSCAAHILISPPKPTLAATCSFLLMAVWWQPNLWALSSVWKRGKSGWLVEWTWMDEEPEEERIWDAVVLREKMSVGWAKVPRVQMLKRGRRLAVVLPWSMVCVVRYCFDWQIFNTLPETMEVVSVPSFTNNRNFCTLESGWTRQAINERE